MPTAPFTGQAGTADVPAHAFLTLFHKLTQVRSVCKTQMLLCKHVHQTPCHMHPFNEVNMASDYAQSNCHSQHTCTHAYVLQHMECMRFILAKNTSHK